jgi:hypothetical protein
VADAKISGIATAATTVAYTDEIPVNATATPGVSGTTKRATAQMVTDSKKRTSGR